MAGVGAVVSSLSEGEWPLCHDGLILQPLDILFLLFKNKGKNATGYNVCFVGEHFKFPLLRNILPDSTPFYTPDDLIDSLVCLLISSAAVVLGITMGKLLWERIDPQFSSITPSHKKWYVVANISKAFFLGCMCFTSRYWIGTYYSYKNDNMEIQLNFKRCAILYIATDLVALFMVPKLPFSTVLHHVTTTSLILMVSAVNIQVKGYSGLLGVSKMAILYGIFSTMPFLVNAYLALRVVYSGKWLHVLVKMGLWPYVLCCACNWTVHLLWLCSLVYKLEIGIINMLYLLAIATMVNDDIVLMRWLIKRSSPGIGEDKKQKKEN